jgi:hypothetical protein
METTRPEDQTPAPVVPEERQAWGAQGYATGQEVPDAEPPEWGPNGYAGTVPGREAGAADDLDASGASEARVVAPDAAIQEEDHDPGDEGPGTHPASVIAGR